MRQNDVKLSEEEHAQLTEYKEKTYPEHTPFGYIISQLIEEVDNE